MAYEYTVYNKGNILKLSGQQSKWQIRSVTGLNPPSSRIQESEFVGVPGVRKTGSKVGKRNIVITLHINHPCERNRDELLTALNTDDEITLQIKTPRKDVTIKGTIESNEYEVYTRSQEMQISILCDYPYFKSGKERVTNYVESTGGFEFPMSFEEDDTFDFDNLDILDRFIVYNYGQITTGLKIELQVHSYSDELKVYNVDDPTKYFSLKGGFETGDRILIDTNINADDKVVLIRNGIQTKILNRLMYGVTWFQIKDILVLGVEGNAYMTITNQDELAGV